MPVSSSKNGDTSRSCTHGPVPCQVSWTPTPFIFSAPQWAFSKCSKPTLALRAQNIRFLCWLPKWKQTNKQTNAQFFLFLEVSFYPCDLNCHPRRASLRHKPSCKRRTGSQGAHFPLRNAEGILRTSGKNLVHFLLMNGICSWVTDQNSWMHFNVLIPL